MAEEKERRGGCEKRVESKESDEWGVVGIGEGGGERERERGELTSGAVKGVEWVDGGTRGVEFYRGKD